MKPEIKDKFIFFDFDGVLCDTVEILEDYFHQNYNMNKDRVKSIYEKNCFENKEISKILEDNKKEIEDFFKLRVNSNSFFEGSREFIDFCNKHFEIFIISSADSSDIKRHLSLIQREDSFREILGMDFEKSKLKKFKYLMKKYNINKEDILFITDTSGDIREANLADINSVGVSWGLHFRSTLQEAGPFKIVDTFDELKKLVIDYFKI